MTDQVVEGGKSVASTVQSGAQNVGSSIGNVLGGSK